MPKQVAGMVHQSWDLMNSQLVGFKTALEQRNNKEARKRIKIIREEKVKKN